jgi:hypothetical protein
MELEILELRFTMEEIHRFEMNFGYKEMIEAIGDVIPEHAHDHVWRQFSETYKHSISRFYGYLDFPSKQKLVEYMFKDIRQTRETKKSEFDLAFEEISTIYNVTVLKNRKDCPYCGAELNSLSACITGLSINFVHDEQGIVWSIGCEVILETSCCFENLGLIMLPNRFFKRELIASKYMRFLKENLGIPVNIGEFKQFLKDCITECDE